VPVLSRLIPAPLITEIGSGVIGSLGERLADGRIAASGRLLVISNGGTSERIVTPLHETFPKAHFVTRCPTRIEHVGELIESVRCQAFEAVVGVGGGRVLDAAKYLATRLGIPSVVVPTALAHDGIASPVSILENDAGRGSYGVAAPIAVLVDLDVIAAAPARFARSGIGDLLSNLCAVADWQLAHARGLDDLDGLAAAMASSAAWAVIRLQGEPTSHRFLTVLTEALILSGLAMSVAGSSRPCSGACHEISHALDLCYPTRTSLHGEQVAVGACFATMLRGDEEMFATMVAAARRSGLGLLPEELGLTVDEFARVVEIAPSTRPGRHTILEELSLDHSAVTRAVSDYRQQILSIYSVPSIVRPRPADLDVRDQL
jgi:glycerol-1-phosphate dehydrogenase [NAD(P)+]